MSDQQVCEKMLYIITHHGKVNFKKKEGNSCLFRVSLAIIKALKWMWRAENLDHHWKYHAIKENSLDAPKKIKAKTTIQSNHPISR